MKKIIVLLSAILVLGLTFMLGVSCGKKRVIYTQQVYEKNGVLYSNYKGGVNVYE